MHRQARSDDWGSLIAHLLAAAHVAGTRECTANGHATHVIGNPLDLRKLRGISGFAAGSCGFRVGRAFCASRSCDWRRCCALLCPKDGRSRAGKSQARIERGAGSAFVRLGRAASRFKIARAPIVACVLRLIAVFLKHSVHSAAPIPALLFWEHGRSCRVF